MYRRSYVSYSCILFCDIIMLCHSAILCVYGPLKVIKKEGEIPYRRILSSKHRRQSTSKSKKYRQHKAILPTRIKTTSTCSIRWTIYYRDSHGWTELDIDECEIESILQRREYANRTHRAEFECLVRYKNYSVRGLWQLTVFIPSLFAHTARAASCVSPAQSFYYGTRLASMCAFLSVPSIA